MSTNSRITAFAPGCVSCLFKVIPHPDPRHMHSLGMGFTVSDGVKAEVVRAPEMEILFNGEPIDFPTVRTALTALAAEQVRVELHTSLSLASGFGLSGASTIAALYAVNEMFDLGETDLDLAMRAHVAEVENLTGLGDVCGQFHGGCLAKLKEGDPLKASVLPVPEQIIHFRYFGPIKTSEGIGDPNQRQLINQAADAALGGLSRLLERKEEDLNAYIELARIFAEDSGLLADGRVRETIDDIEASGGSASMIMLGNAVFSTQPFAGSRKTELSRRKAGLTND